MGIALARKKMDKQVLGHLIFNRDAGSRFRRAAREMQEILHLGQKLSVYR
jgi:hypothetical protein